ncbi:sodium/hydrogen exchanger 10-like [Aethina tumida]|uniref:sodium/hydrogen exchanger 10-like n=1 Tax=Aethina tumida TaxID=116153 RepID=UPI00214897D6|nr:sodium/hydrogen exchanger 10-like [Aethina tumida]
MSEYITVLYSGCIIGKIVMDDIIPYDALLGIILFILITVCRVLIYMILSPILIHIGYYLGYTEIMVAAFGFYVNPMMVIALLMTLTNPQEFSLGVRILTIYMVVQLCSMFVSTVIFMASFRFTKFSQFSMAAKTNMNNSIEHLKITTANFIFILKTDKSNYDTDWNMVTKYSTLKHPYESDLDYDMTNILSKNLVVTCPNCLRDTPRKLSKREQNEIKLVTKNRILIARKIAYLRHINAGTITYDAGNTLIFIVEDAIGSPKKEIKMKHFRNRFSLKSLTRNVVKMLSEVLFFDVLHRAPRPKSVMYCLCWILVKYHVTDAIIILTNMTAFVLMITLWKIDFILLDPFVIYIFEIVFITLALSSPKFFPTGIKHSAK